MLNARTPSASRAQICVFSRWRLYVSRFFSCFPQCICLCLACRYCGRDFILVVVDAIGRFGDLRCLRYSFICFRLLLTYFLYFIIKTYGPRSGNFCVSEIESLAYRLTLLQSSSLLLKNCNNA